MPSDLGDRQELSLHLKGQGQTVDYSGCITPYLLRPDRRNALPYESRNIWATPMVTLRGII